MFNISNISDTIEVFAPKAEAQLTNTIPGRLGGAGSSLAFEYLKPKVAYDFLPAILAHHATAVAASPLYRLIAAFDHRIAVLAAPQGNFVFAAGRYHAGDNNCFVFSHKTFKTAETGLSA